MPVTGRRLFATFGTNNIVGLFFSQHLHMCHNVLSEPVQPVTAF
jgi:hypothetical protein